MDIVLTEESKLKLRKLILQGVTESLFFDKEWYVKNYGIGKKIDPAEHYVFDGWKLGYDPSPLFSTKKYLMKYPHVKYNPLLYYIHEGRGKGEHPDCSMQQLRKYYPALLTDMKDGILRLRITNACNSKCRYCGVRLTYGIEKNHSMDKKWLYELCTPLYKQIKSILITGGEPYSLEESYPFMKFLSRNYPGINIFTESNGILFDKKFQCLAAENLFMTHFSLNGSNEAVFQQSCWEGTGGEAIYRKMLKNVYEYVMLLRRMGRECFAPSISMVINRDSCGDILSFVELGLTLSARAILFYFDYTENNMAGKYFRNPENNRRVLRQLLELERVFAGKVYIYFRLWIPGGELSLLEPMVNQMDIGVLESKYAALVDLAAGRSMKKEFEARNSMRIACGKKVLLYEEDLDQTLHKDAVSNICFAPWHELDLYPNGRIDFCSWYKETINIKDYIKNGSLDWYEVMNSYEYMEKRKAFLAGIYEGCLEYCPMKPCIDS